MLYILLINLFITLASAYSIKGFVPKIQKDDLESTTLVLRNIDNGDLSRTYLSTKGNFSFESITDGNYILTLDSSTLTSLSNFRLDIAEGNLAVYKINAGQDVTAGGPAVPYPIVVDTKRNVIIVPRPTFSFLAMIRQPTVLMSLGMLVLVAFMPTLLGMIDPAALEEMQEREAERNQATAKITSDFDLAKIMADRHAKK